jgi:predicted anti-sigma-YlaC factor YlaD
MNHLSAEIIHRFLARALKPREILAATQHLRVCESCRQKAIVLRQTRPVSLSQQILTSSSTEDHPSADLLIAFVDDDLKPIDCEFIQNHTQNCEACSEILSDLRSFRMELGMMPTKAYRPRAPSAAA